MRRAARESDRSFATIAVCFAVALLEGLDLQSTGIAAPQIARAFGFSLQQMSWILSVSALGLLPGSAIGGRLADRFGRKRLLVLSVAMFGVCSLLTARAWSFETLIVSRFLTGLGMGAAMPNLIALCSEASATNRNGTAVGLMYCGMPFGAAFASATSVLATGENAWRMVFYVGGFGPLLVLPLIAFWLPESARFIASRQRREPGEGRNATFKNALWREGRAAATLALWSSYFCTLVVLYFLMNWLPSLMVAHGLSRAQSAFVHLMFNIGSGVGAIAISYLMDRGTRRATVLLTYGGTAAALIFLSLANTRPLLAVGALLVGLFLVGAQSLLYTLAGEIYPTVVRGTGVGSAVAVGRLGAIAGPLAAGQLLALGQSSSVLLVASVGLIFVSTLAALLLPAHRQSASAHLRRMANESPIP